MLGGGGARGGSQHYQLESHAHPWGCNPCFPGSSGRSGGKWVTDLLEMILIPYISPTCTIHCFLAPSELSNHHYYQFWNISITPESHSCSSSVSTHSTPGHQQSAFRPGCPLPHLLRLLRAQALCIWMRTRRRHRPMENQTGLRNRITGQ